MSESHLDLSRLALDRSPPASTSGKSNRSHWLLRYGLPICILLGFIALLGSAVGRQWLPKTSVTVVPVIVKKGEVQQEGTTLFQAAGWIEPRPTSVSVAALTPGVIEELLVVEGQRVAKGEPIARLISIDAELAVEQANATLAIREGEVQRAMAEKDAAVIRLEKPVHLKVQLADANSLLAKSTTELEKLPFLIEAAEADVEFTRSSLESKRAAKSAIAGVVVKQAAKDFATANAKLKELKKRGPNLQNEVKALQGKVEALQQQLELLVEENRQLQEAKAKVISATAIRDEAKSRLRQAQLNLKRTVVLAPITGRILRLLASPGRRVMGLDSKAGHNSSTVAEMYNPAKLQVRADVRLEDVPMVMLGAPVEIKTASSGKMIKGRVLQLTSSANIQKNTLEVKVELIEPSTTVSPEMLVTTTFLAPKTLAKTDEAAETQRIFVPQQLIQTGDGGSFVWIVDSNGLAKRKTLTIGKISSDRLVEIINGLNMTDKLISSGTENLSNGDAVAVVGEDQTIGVER